MSERINPDFTKNIGKVYFRLYDRLDILLPINDWKFLCDKRWFSDNPNREIVEAEFGLYNARNAKNSEEAMQCIHDCVQDLKDIMGLNTSNQCQALLESNASTLLTVDKDGNLVLQETDANDNMKM